MISKELQRSYRACAEISRRQAANFYPAFRVLPHEQRRAMCALYAFFRITDDLSDEPGPPDSKRQALRRWRGAFQQALHGEYAHPIHPALHHALKKYAVPARYLEAVIDGVEMDLLPVAYETFEELRHYCYHVASVVGLACIHVWGFTDERAIQLAESAGIAFQLTNILRDLGEDAQRNRIYLPREELHQFSCDARNFNVGRCDEAFRSLMRFQVQRARRYYEQAGPLIPLLRPAGRAVFLVMVRTYRALLENIEKCNFDVFSRRVRVSGWQKFHFALRALPVRWGWTVS